MEQPVVVQPPGDEEAVAAVAYLGQRGQHVRLAVAVVAWFDDPRRRIDADDKDRAGIEPRLEVERRRVGGIDRIAPGELAQPVEHSRRRQRWFVDVDGRQLERHRSPQQRRRRFG